MQGRGINKKVYQIKIKEQLNESWADWFEGFSMSFETIEGENNITVLTGEITDQSALNGILSKIWSLNLTVLSVGTK
jgi:hypothetical protein